MLITTCPRSALTWLMHDKPYVVIYIDDPPMLQVGPPTIPVMTDSNRLGILRLEFCDLGERHFEFKHGRDTLSKWAMTESHANAVRSFLKDLWAEKFETIVISCEAGVSRSPSMALAIAEHYGIPRYQIEPVCRNWDAQPLNPWVYKITREALQETKSP